MIGEKEIIDILKKNIPKKSYAEEPESLEYTVESIMAIIADSRRWAKVNNLVHNMKPLLPENLRDDRDFLKDLRDDCWEIKEETEEEYVLELTPTPKSDVDYAKLTMWVDKAHYIPSKVEYYNKKGNVLKVMKNENIEKVDNYWTPRKVTMENLKTEHKTVMELVKVMD